MALPNGGAVYQRGLGTVALIGFLKELKAPGRWSAAQRERPERRSSPYSLAYPGLGFTQTIRAFPCDALGLRSERT